MDENFVSMQILSSGLLRRGIVAKIMHQLSIYTIVVDWYR